MAENEELIRRYIMSIIKEFSPRNEEFIHSCLFLINCQYSELGIKDWYSNGYAVLSETIASAIKKLCEQGKIFYSNDGTYKITNSPENNEELINRIKTLVSFNCGYYRLINKAIEYYNNLVYKKPSM